MTTVTLFIAASLDGCIADADGGLDWLFHDPDYGFTPFFAGAQAIVMGRRTYETCLGLGEWRSAPAGEGGR